MESLQLNRPYAIMLVGIPGSGKSFFGVQFAETFGAPYIDSITLEKLSRDEEASGELVGIMLGEVAKTHQTFVFEGNSDSRTNRSEFSQWARSKGYQPILVWVQTDQQTSLKRALKTGSSTKESFEQTLKSFSPPHPDEKAIVISGKHTYSSQARTVLAVLSRGTRPQNTPLATPVRPATAAPEPPRTAAPSSGGRRSITIG